MATRAHVVAGVGIGIGIGAVVGYLVREMFKPVAEVPCTDEECRKMGFIRPEECPEKVVPCPPPEQITTKELCEKCGYEWHYIPGTFPGRYECRRKITVTPGR